MNTYLQRPDEGQKLREIARLRKLLIGLQNVPDYRRQDECADERMSDVVAALKQLGDECRDVKIVEILPGI